MTKPILREFKVEDYLKIHRRRFDLLTFLNFPNPEIVAKNLAQGPAFTGLIDGEILACGGILPLWKGVGEAWVVTSLLVNQYPLSFAKTIWRKLKEIIIEHQFERVQTVIDADYVISQRWAERMGFEYEGLMRKYIGGRKFYRYAWVRED